MKKKPIRFLPVLVLCIITIASALAACQPTPDQDVIVNKGEGQLQEKIEAPPSRQSRWKHLQPYRSIPSAQMNFRLWLTRM
jgi:hypothetical protein